jgi:diguanylate cyclase (GGDEF)-like protein
VTRFGGDEFAILARELAGSEDATNIALRVIKELDQPIATGPLKHHVGVAIGIALLPQDGRSEIEILRRADIALYRAKDEKPPRHVGQRRDRFYPEAARPCQGRALAGTL